MTNNKYKALAIISDCIHVVTENGEAATENHIFCRQIQELASRFERTNVVCPFVKMKEGFVVSKYTLPTIKFIPLPNVGGSTIKDKLAIVQTIPAWLSAFAKAHKESDIVYLRMPNNVSIPAFFYFKAKNKKWFSTYTGTWENYKGEPLTYRFQKWLLKRFFNGPVSIYVHEKPVQQNLHKGISPSYSVAEWHEETTAVEKKIECYNNAGITHPVFITVGALVPNKNQQYILDTCKRLHDEGFIFTWYIVGDGYMKQAYEAFIKQHHLEAQVILAGKKTYKELRELYRQSNFLMQATLVEGFGKVPIEAMFHGVIPVLSKTALSGEMTGNGSRGFSFDALKKDDLYNVIKVITGKTTMYAAMINDGRRFVKEQTLESWADTFINLINE